MHKLVSLALSITCICLLVLSACKEDSPRLPEHLSPLVQAYTEDASPENKRNLAQGIAHEINAQEVPDQPLLASAVKYAEDLKDDKLLAVGLRNQVKHYFQSPETASRLERLADLNAGSLKKPNVALALRQGYIASFPSGKKVGEYKNAIPQYLESADSFLFRMASNIIDEKNIFDKNRARDYVDASECAVMSNPTHPNADQFLFNAAKTASTVEDYKQTLELYDWIIKQYPNSDLVGKSLFMKAFTYDTNLEDQDNAKIHYEQFIDKYPTDELADDAQFLLDNLGVSEEELLKRILEGQAKK